MIAQRFGQFVLKGRLQAAGLALLFTVLPFCGWLAGIIVGLVTLRKGAAEGFMVLLWTILPALVLLVVLDDWLPFMMTVIYGTFLVWLLATVLRNRHNWSLLLVITAVLGMIGVAVFYMAIPNLHAWWMHHGLKQASQDGSFLVEKLSGPAAVDQTKAIAGKIVTGLTIMFYSLIALLELFFARALESLMFNPDGLRVEAKRIRMPLLASLLLVACLIMARVGTPVFLNLLIVMSLPFLLAGVSLIHSLMVMKNLSLRWFFVFYIVLFVSLFLIPLIPIAIVVMAMLDSGIDFRGRWANA